MIAARPYIHRYLRDTSMHIGSGCNVVFSHYMLKTIEDITNLLFVSLQRVCVCVYMYTYIYILTHTHTHTYDTDGVRVCVCVRT